MISSSESSSDIPASTGTPRLPRIKGRCSRASAQAVSGAKRSTAAPYFTIRLRTRTPKTARIRIFASTTSTSVFAGSRSATRLLKIVDEFCFADASRCDQCVQLLARLAQSIQIRLLPFAARGDVESHGFTVARDRHGNRGLDVGSQVLTKFANAHSCALHVCVHNDNTHSFQVLSREGHGANGPWQALVPGTISLSGRRLSGDGEAVDLRRPQRPRHVGSATDRSGDRGLRRDSFS